MVAPVLNELEGEVIVIVIEEEPAALSHEVDLSVEVHVSVKTPEPRSEVAREGYVGDGNNDTPPLGAITSVSSGMQTVRSLNLSVERSEKLDVDEFARVEISKALGETENSTHAASAIA